MSKSLRLDYLPWVGTIVLCFWLARLLSSPLANGVGLRGVPTSNGLLQDHFTCEAVPYEVRLISHEPLVLHLSHFISPTERTYLINSAKPRLSSSLVWFANSEPGFDGKVPGRTSTSTNMSNHDPVVECIAQRAIRFQGLPSTSFMEVQITSYLQGQEFQPHLDPFETRPRDGYRVDRETSIFAILDADCVQCGTNFPKVPVDWSARDASLCDVMECIDTTLTAKAVPGNALFWRNFQSDGSPNEKTVHAGLPLPEGFKIGMNIWTWARIPADESVDVS